MRRRAASGPRHSQMTADASERASGPPPAGPAAAAAPSPPGATAATARRADELRRARLALSFDKKLNL